MKSKLEPQRLTLRWRSAKTKPTRFCCRFDWITSPSIRMSVTPANRGTLRMLRAAEMQAWEEVSKSPITTLATGLVVVRRVRATVCSQCGEEWIDDATAHRLEQVVNAARSGHREVEITAFAQSSSR